MFGGGAGVAWVDNMDRSASKCVCYGRLCVLKQRVIESLMDTVGAAEDAWVG